MSHFIKDILFVFFLLYISQGISFSQEEEAPVAPINNLIFSNFMSPNDDGHNDTFTILNIELYPENKLSIYSRWGELIFEASPYANDWSGKSNKGLINDVLPEGVYFYVLTDGFDQTFNGKITLKR